jgi:hypothetical protein
VSRSYRRILAWEPTPYPSGLAGTSRRGCGERTMMLVDMHADEITLPVSLIQTRELAVQP